MRYGVSLLAILFASASMVWADSIEFLNGERVDGTFKQASATEVIFQIGGQDVTFSLDKVKAIIFGARVATSPTSSAPSQGASPKQSALREVLVKGSPWEVVYCNNIERAKDLAGRPLEVALSSCELHGAKR